MCEYTGIFGRSAFTDMEVNGGDLYVIIDYLSRSMVNEELPCKVPTYEVK